MPLGLSLSKFSTTPRPSGAAVSCHLPGCMLCTGYSRLAGFFFDAACRLLAVQLNNAGLSISLLWLSYRSFRAHDGPFPLHVRRVIPLDCKIRKYACMIHQMSWPDIHWLARDQSREGWWQPVWDSWTGTLSMPLEPKLAPCGCRCPHCGPFANL